jgi:hypothetical protein
MPFLMRRDVCLTPDELYAALHGRVISVGRERWQLEVFSVVDDEAGPRWVQLAMKGEPDYPVTLQLDRTTKPENAVLALVRWLFDPAPPNGKPLIVH